MAIDVDKIRNVYPEQIEFLCNFDPNTKWYYRSCKHKLFVEISDDSEYLILTNSKGERINAYSASMIIFNSGGVQNFIEKKCKQVNVTFDVWKNALLSGKPIPSSMPRRKRQRINATLITKK